MVRETRSGYLPLETVRRLDHERVDVRDISMASPYSLTGSGDRKTFDISGITAAHHAVVKQTPFSLYNYHAIDAILEVHARC